MLITIQQASLRLLMIIFRQPFGLALQKSENRENLRVLDH
jgi:hypothetical protein